nr:PilC/PilY family type IV pilus protein [uncultured Desulfobulbus sp.]
MKLFLTVSRFLMLLALLSMGIQTSIANATDYTISVSSAAPVVEGSTTAVVTVSLSPAVATGEQVAISWATVDGTATAASGDYNAATGTLVFDPGDSAKSISVAANTDGTVENSESLKIHVSNPTFVSGSGVLSGDTDVERSVTITNVETATVTLSGVVVDGTEGTSLSYKIDLSNPVADDVVVNYSVAGSGTDAAEGTDYTSGSSVIIPAGQTTSLILINLDDDLVVENDEELTITLGPLSSTITAVSLGSATTAVGTIRDNDSASLSINDVSVAENGGSVSFTVSSSATVESSASVSFDYTTQDGTATASADYTAQSGTGTISGGNSTVITVPITDDLHVEGAETFTLKLSNSSSNASFSDDEGLATITDNDSASLSINDVSVAENGGSVSFTVTSSASIEPSAGVSFDFATSDGTAVAPGDYTASSGTETIASGTSQTITVPIQDDAILEGSETFTVQLSNPIGGVSIADNEGVATITDNDSASLSINDVSVAENGGSVSFTVTSSAPIEPSASVSFDFTTNDGTAVAPGDYTTSSGTETIASGTSQTITVPIQDDAILEGSETFTVQLSNPIGGVSIADNEGVATITDNDSASLSINDVSVAENGGSVSFTVTSSAPIEPSASVSFDFTTNDGTAVAPGDYTTSSGTATIASGTSQNITVPVQDDAILEGSETFTVKLSNPSSGVSIADNEGVGTITDNDSTSLSINDVSVAEDGTSATFTVTSSATIEPSASVSFDFTTNDGTAVAPGDYTTSSGTETIASGTSQTITVPIQDDAILEGSETFKVQLSNPSSGVSIADNEGVATITDNDSASLSINDVSVAEDGGSVSFTVTSSASIEPSASVSFDFTTNDGTAVALGDYTTSSGTATIASGTSQNITVPIQDDAILEGSETFTVKLSNPSSGVTLADDEGQGTITDNDSTSLSINDVSVAEDGTSATFTVTSSATIEPSASVSFDFTTNDGTAVAPGDYTTSSGTETIASGTSQTITVPIQDDAILEGSETFKVQLSNPSSGVSIADNEGVATITDNDSASLSINDVSVAEDGGSVSFTVTSSATIEPSAGVSFDFATSDGTALAPGDYTTSSGTANIASGTSQNITVPIQDDAILEGSETFTVKLSNPSSGVSIADNEGVGTITDNDSTSLSINDVSVAEDGTSATFTVTSSATIEPSASVSFDFTTNDGTAVAPGDYTTSSGTETIASGTSQTITVPIQDDAILEGSETFTVKLSNPSSGVSIADNEGVATITDNDSASLSINDVSVAEDGGSVSFTVTSSATIEPSASVSFDFTTADGTALAPGDYTTSSGTATIASGTSQNITVPIQDDAILEGSETFTVKLSNPSTGVTLADDEGQGTITDNDSASLSINDVSVAEDGTSATFTVTSSATIEPSASVSFDFTTNDGTAVAPGDYTTSSGTATIASGTSQNITVPIQDDAILEGSETFTVKLSNPSSGVTLADDEGQGTITDNDSASLSINDVSVAEDGGSVSFTVTSSAPIEPSASVSFDFTTNDGTAVAPGDYTTSSGTATIASGTSQNITVPIQDDAILEGSETFTVKLSNPSSGVTLADDEGQGTITDNDSASLSINDVSVVEDGGSVSFTVTSSAPIEPSASVSFDFTTSDGTAVAPGDYTTSSGTATIASGTSQTITVPVQDDAILEGSETFKVQLSNPSSGVSIADNEGVATITDNDSASLSINDVSVAEDGTSATFTVTSSATIEPSASVSFDFTTADGTALAPGDYTTSSGTATIASGTSQTITVPVQDDAILEGSETFKVQLSNPSSGVSIADNEGVATITDNDSASLSINDVSVAEDGTSATFTVTSSATIEPSASVSFDFTTADGTALAPGDYTTSSGTATIASGTSQTITVPVQDDAILEGSETFKVQLSNPSSGVSIADNEGVATITDNDSASLSINDVTVAENSGNAVFTVTSSVTIEPSANASFNYSSYNGTAVNPQDYLISLGRVTISSGTSKTILVPLLDDTLHEGNETFTVKLTTPSPGVSFADDEGEATITDNDSTILSINDVSVAEDGGSVTFTVTSSATIESSANLSFDFTTVDGTAVSASDYAAYTGTGVIASGTTASVTVPILDDVVVESQEQFSVQVTAAHSSGTASVSSTQGSGQCTINDNDYATLSIDDVAQYEDAGPFVFTVKSNLVVAPNASITVDYATIDGTAKAGSDYVALTGTATISGGDSTPLSVSVISDNNTPESDEIFNIQLSNPSAQVSGFIKDVGVGTILNDDYLITITDISPFGSITETTGLGVTPTSGDVNSLVYSRGSSPVFEINAEIPCPNGLGHNGKSHSISDVLIDGTSETSAIGQSTYTYSFTSISQDHSIEALFTSYVDFDVDANGHIETGSGNVAAGSQDSIEVQANATLKVTAVPDSGFHISDVQVDGVSVGIPETYSFENWIDADATYKILFAINDFVLEPVSTYKTIFNDSAESVVATTKTITYGSSGSFYVNLNDSSYAIYGILIDNISYPIPASGVAVNYTGFTLTNTANDYLEVKFLAVDANHRLEVQDYDTSPISDTPLDAKLRPKPAAIMFVLDDSGSMDWETITTDSDGRYGGTYEYVYSYPDTVRARVYGDNSLEKSNQQAQWRSQFFGVNKMFYNPGVTYVPWPTFTGTPTSQLPAVATDGLAHANIYRPRFHPWYSQDCTDAINLANGVTTANLNNCDNTTQNTHTFPMDDVFLEYEDNTDAIIVDNTTAGSFSTSGNWGTSTNSDMYGSNYLYTIKNKQPHTATWTLSPTKTATYQVYTRWVDTADRQNIPYTINCASCGGGITVNMDQRYQGGKWNSLGEYSFTAGETVTIKLTDNFNQTSSSCADAVKIVPKGDSIKILNAHYFTWDDADGDGEIDYVDADSNGLLDRTETITEDIYLVNLSDPVEYYKVLNNSSVLSSTNLQAITAAALPSTVVTFASPSDANAWLKERQNWSDWFSYYRKRTLAATGAVARVIDQMEDVEVGIRSINASSSYGIIQSVLPVNVAGVGDETNTLLAKLYSFQVEGKGTPLRQGLQKVGQYFDDTDYDSLGKPITGGVGTSPYNAKEDGDECKQVFAVVMTDGYWNGSNPSPSVGNADGNNGAPYSDGYSNTLADVAMYYFENDLSSMDNLVPDGIYNHQHMVTYTVAFGVYGTLNPSDYDFNKSVYPTWPSPWVNPTDEHKIDDMWHAAVNGRGKYMSASRPDELVDSLLDIMNDIGTRVGSGASVSVNGDEMYESVSGQTRMFQTTYNSGDWHGDLKSYMVDTTTGNVVTNAPVWSAEDQLATKLTATGTGHVNRVIASYNGTAGVAFRWADLSALQQKQLFPYFIESTSTTLTGADVVNYLRGLKTYETSNTGGEFRERDASHPIGDIVHSLARYEDDVLYVGSNDGMLHAFLATDAGLGQELFAYVPNLVMGNLRELADPAYDHLFYVDNTPDTQEMGNSTYLVAGLGKGGKGYYCLDITNAKTVITSESTLASRVKWEYPRADLALGGGTTYSFVAATVAGGNDSIYDSAKGFASSSYYVGQTISVSGATSSGGSNDGMYTIKSIASDGSSIEVASGSLSTGYGNGATVSLSEAYVLLTGNTFTFSSGTGTGGNDVIADSNSGFSPSIFAVGQVISVIGANYADGLNSGTNDGQYKITKVDSAGGYIEIQSGSLVTGYGNHKNITFTKANIDPKLGYSFSKAYFVETNDLSIGSGDLQGWVVVFGNGYGSENGTAILYVLDPSTGEVIKRIETGVGPFNGLSTPNAIDVDNDLRVDYVYAGDLLGNMWKFDFTSSNHDDWQVAYCEGGNTTDHCKSTVSGIIPKPLFAGLSNQPITGAPDIMRHQSGEGYMVIFGTGKYVGEPDLSSIYTQSLYGIWDWAPDYLDTGYNGARVDVGSTSPQTATLSNWPETDTAGDATHTLLRQVALSEGYLDTDGDGVVETSSYYRNISNYSGTYTLTQTSKLSAGHRFRNKDINGDGSVDDNDLVPDSNVGWVFDLPSKIDIDGDGQDNDKDGTIDESGERIPGERVVNDTVIRDGKAIILSFGLTGTRCNSGAYSFLNERDANTGGMTSSAVYDLNGDGEIDADDGVQIQVNYDANNDGKIDSSDVITAYPSDIAYEGRLYNPAILRESDDSDKDPEEKKYFSTSQGAIIVVSEKAEKRGFSYWQQME